MESLITLFAFLQDFTVVVVVCNRWKFVDFCRFANSVLAAPFPEFPRASFIFCTVLCKTLAD